ncbi:replication initiator protein A (plasmid) [Acuticoccus sp. MNP-M23]|uniref:replication initiator protein A n=1 Tax=Acuticoccus sp. MNP-M23 TaxID=3072793 RepID=UPI002815295C|nr:replication initiator protein A [Acuticoccus sp. MNP-M23]WMS45375.1 replication initiator protein A [Acuticoccus sp. MNP-M23]
MVSNHPNLREDTLPPSNLTADKRGGTDLFTCDVADAVLKDLMPTLEHPFYSLSKKPVTTSRIYRRGDHWLKIVPSEKGLATIYDKDILIYAVSQLVAAMRRGEEPKQRIRINCRDFLMFANRGTGGKDYLAICDAIERLDGTRIRTNIKTGDEEQFDAFGLIEGGTVRRKEGLDGRILWVEIKLSDFVYNAVRHQEVLTLHPDYFRLSKPMERRLYELARKHCGQQDKWSPYIQTLFEKSGSSGSVKLFRNRVKEICRTNNMPDYELEFLEEPDQVLFMNRDTMPKDHGKPEQSDETILLRLTGEGRMRGREIAAGWDIDYVQSCFAAWWVKIGRPPTKNADALFLKFCRTWQDKRGRPA